MHSLPTDVHDRAYKALRAHPAFVEALLRFLLPYHLVQLFDFSTLKPFASETIGQGRRQIADVCWTVGLQKIEVWVLILVEFQARSDRLDAGPGRREAASRQRRRAACLERAAAFRADDRRGVRETLKRYGAGGNARLFCFARSCSPR